MGDRLPRAGAIFAGRIAVGADEVEEGGVRRDRLPPVIIVARIGQRVRAGLVGEQEAGGDLLRAPFAPARRADQRLGRQREARRLGPPARAAAREAGEARAAAHVKTIGGGGIGAEARFDRGLDMRAVRRDALGIAPCDEIPQRQDADPLALGARAA